MENEEVKEAEIVKPETDGPVLEPTPSAPPEETYNEKYDFYEALVFVSEGKKIHKLEWKDKNIYGHLAQERLLIHKPDGKDYIWAISQADMEGNDYIILNN